MMVVRFIDVPLAARPEPRIWEVLVSTSEHGSSILIEQDGVYFVQWPEDDVPTPFSDLAYKKELGVYNKSRFPDVKEEE